MTHALDDPEQQKRKKKKKEESYGGENEVEMDYFEEQPPPPDGGWGWVVVFASFTIHIIIDGVTYSFGTFQIALKEYFNTGDAPIAWISSILVGVTLCSGPIASIFVNKYGCRTVTIAGAILSSCCILLSSFANNLFILYLTIGLGAGLGFGLIYLPAIVCVTVYFEKLRSLATGIAVCGSGVGTFVFAPLCEYLIKELEWHNAFRIISVILLSSIILGVLFRPLKPIRRPNNVELKEVAKVLEITVTECEKNGEPMNGIARPQSASNLNQITYKLEQENTNGSNLIKVAMSQPILTKRHSHQSSHSIKSSDSGIMNKPDIFFQGSLDNIRQQYNAVLTDKNRASYRASRVSMSNGKEKQNEIVDVTFSNEESSMEIIHKMLALNLLENPIFLIFLVSNFCTSVGFNIPYIYIQSYAKERLIEESKGNFLVSVIGVANTIGRIVLGYISDKAWINRLLTYNICLTVCGISTVLCGFCYSYESLIVYSSVFGFTAGAYVGLTSIVLVDLMGLEHLTNGFGLVLLFQGFASFLGAPLGGWLHDILYSYNSTFFLAGGMITASGLMLYAIPIMKNHLKQREFKRESMATEIIS